MKGLLITYLSAIPLVVLVLGVQWLRDRNVASKKERGEPLSWLDRLYEAEPGLTVEEVERRRRQRYYTWDDE